jgi:predicted nucleic acid-binding protein
LIVAFDASMLIYLFDEKASSPLDKKTGKSVTHCQSRVEHLILTLQQTQAKIVIPTPSLAEVLVRAQVGAPERLKILKESKHFRIASFDERAAIEFAAAQATRISSGIKPAQGLRTKAKFDDQIISIATVEGAMKIYSDDEDIFKAAASKIEVIGIADLPLPPENSQPNMFEQSES